MFKFDIYKDAKEISKAKASAIDPKTGTTTRFLQYFVIAGVDAIKKLKAEKEPVIKANSERLAKKYAEEANAPIYAELTDGSNAIKDSVRTHFNNGIDAREEQNNRARTMPIRKDSMELLQTIRMMIDLDVDIPETNWKLWAEKFAGHPNEELVFAGLAKRKDIDIIPSSNPDRNHEQLETLRKMGNIAIDYLDHPEDSVTALSFLNDNPNSPLAKLMSEIDSDLASIIPAEKLTVLQRLKDAKEHAYNNDDVRLSVKIGSFIDRNIDKLATPEEINEALFAEAEDMIRQGMTAKKGE